MITIVLADDHTIVRHGIKALLQVEPDLSVIGEAANGQEAVTQTEKLRPDILVTDISMPLLSGIQVTKKVCSLCPKTAVIILSMHSAYPYVALALEAGARGYIIKDSGPDQLIEGIREVKAGRTYIGPPLSLEAVEKYMRKSDSLHISTKPLLPPEKSREISP